MATLVVYYCKAQSVCSSYHNHHPALNFVMRQVFPWRVNPPNTAATLSLTLLAEVMLWVSGGTWRTPLPDNGKCNSYSTAEGIIVNTGKSENESIPDSL